MATSRMRRLNWQARTARGAAARRAGRKLRLEALERRWLLSVTGAHHAVGESPMPAWGTYQNAGPATAVESFESGKVGGLAHEPKDPPIEWCEDIAVDTTWDEDTVLTCDVSVKNGATLTVRPGVTVTQAHANYELHVGNDALGGSLDADGANLLAEMYFYANGEGTIQNSMITDLEVLGSTGPQLSGNTFSGTAPAKVTGEYVPELKGPDVARNVFDTPGAIVQVLGSTIDRDTTWWAIDNLNAYRLEGYVRVKGGATLTVDPGATVTQRYADDEFLVGNDVLGGFLNANGADLLAGLIFYAYGGGVIQNCIIPDLEVRGNTGPQLSGNTFSGTAPAKVTGEYVPELKGPDVARNVFDTPGAIVQVFGSTIDRDTTWWAIDNLNAYRLEGYVYVVGGATLTVDASATVTQHYADDEFLVGSDVLGGFLDADGANLLAGMIFYTYGGGVIQNCIITDLEVRGNTGPQLSGNTFSGTAPAKVTGEYVPELKGPDVARNVFDTPGAIVQVLGSTIDRDTTWWAIDNLNAYRLEGYVGVNGGATLTVDTGATVTQHYGDDEFLVGNDVLGGFLDADGADLRAGMIFYAYGGGVIQNCITTDLEVHGSTGPELTGNTFSGTAPAKVTGEYVPELKGPDVARNVFDTPGAIVQVLGSTIDRDTTWWAIDNLNAYRLEGYVGVNGGATLTVDTGATVTQHYGDDEFLVGNDVLGGFLNANGADLLAGLIFYAYGGGVIQNCTITDLEVYGSTGPELTGNTFSGTAPAKVTGEYVPELKGPDVARNIFDTPGAIVQVLGSTIDRDTTWWAIDNLNAYRLEGYVRVKGGATLTVGAGATVTQHYGDDDLLVGNDVSRGSLDASCATFTIDMVLGPFSGGTLRFNRFPGATLQIYGASDASIHWNDFEEARIVAVGSPDETIDLRENWWGTTDSAEIEPMIQDQFDDPRFPLVIFEPFLLCPPQVPNLAAASFSVPEGPLFAGQSVTVSYQVDNLSPAAEVGCTGDAGWSATLFYLNADDSLQGAAYLEMVATEPLAAGESTGPQTIDLTLPDADDPVWGGRLPSTYRLSILADALNQVAECDEINNLRSVPIVAGEPASVLDRHIFYNNSAFDGNDPLPNAGDDQAIAPDPADASEPRLGKTALLPGQTATFANYTSYSRGINGIMVDVAGAWDADRLGADDFRFRVGNSNDPAGWTAAPAPNSVSARSGAGVDGSDRVTLIWDDYAIQKRWLQVAVRSTTRTGLPESDVFYFGNAIGECGDSTTDAKVNAVDMLGARENQRGFLDPAPIDFNFDFDRDARVNAVDMIIVRENTTDFLSALKLITVPGEKSGQAAAGGPERVAARDAGFRQAPWIHQFQQPCEEDSADEAADHQLAVYLP